MSARRVSLSGTGLRDNERGGNEASRPGNRLVMLIHNPPRLPGRFGLTWNGGAFSCMGGYGAEFADSRRPSSACV